MPLPVALKGLLFVSPRDLKLFDPTRVGLPMERCREPAIAADRLKRIDLMQPVHLSRVHVVAAILEYPLVQVQYVPDPHLGVSSIGQALQDILQELASTDTRGTQLSERVRAVLAFRSKRQGATSCV